MSGMDYAGKYIMVNVKKVLLVFLSLVIGLIAIEITTLHFLNDSNRLIQKLYQHPFQITQSTMEVNYRLSAIKTQIKTLPENPSVNEEWQAKQLISAHEEGIIKQFDLIYNKFLGPKEFITNAYSNFLSWYPLYSERKTLSFPDQTKLVHKNWETRDALIQQLEATEIDVKSFHQFANAKAEKIYQESIQYKTYFNLLYLMVFLFVIAGVFIIVIIDIRLKKSKRSLADTKQLLDQNVMMAKLTTNGKVLSASHSLCRYLGLTQEDVIGKYLNFFDNSDQKEDTYKLITDITKTGKVWEGQLKRQSAIGEHQWFYSRLLPRFTKEFEIKSYTNIIVDTTNNHIAMLDPLTGIGNRRSYEQSITKALFDAVDLKIDTSLAIIDIDNFKLYNDYYGHPSGDAALIKVANVLANSVKGTRHSVFRLGGEEFGIILHNLNKDEAYQFFENLRLSMNAQNIPHEKNTVAKHLTISTGISHKNSEQTLTKEDLYLEADKALYLAKIGRNAVYMAK